MSQPVELWASVKNGKWHRIEAMPQHFRDIVKSLCGLSFEPYNVAENKPDYILPSGFCRICLKEIAP